MGIFTQISAAAAGSLVAAVWEGLVLAGCVALCLRLLPGITAAARSVVWTGVMAAVVVLPFVHFPGRGVVGSGGLHLDERVSVALVCVWVALSLYRAGELISSAIYLRRIARSATAMTVEAEYKYGDSGSARMTTVLRRQRVALCVSDEVDRPSVVGFFSPRILLPAALLAKLSAAELEQIVLHEMEHLRRGDDWTNLLQKLSLVVFPLNPVLVWIERRLCLERELACDDQVLRATKARKAYAACLANLAEHSLVRRGVSLALGAWERQSELVRRVHRILFPVQREMSRGRMSVAVGVMLCGLVAGADGLAHSPQLVSFGPRLELAAAPTTHEEPGAKAPGFQLTSFVGLKPHANPAGLAQQVVYRPAAIQSRAKRRVIARTAPRLMAEARQAEDSSDAQNASAVVVMVTWRFVDSRAPATVQSSQVSYAAVPTRNGWLFVQL